MSLRLNTWMVVGVVFVLLGFGLMTADGAVTLDKGGFNILYNLLQEIGDSRQTLIINGEVEVTTGSGETIVPENVSLVIRSPGCLNVVKGDTLIIKGPIQAPPTLCFKGEGKVQIVNGQSVYAEWWGPGGQGIQGAMNALEENGGRINLLNKRYDIPKTIIGASNVELTGATTGDYWLKKKGTRLVYTGEEEAPILDFRGKRGFGVTNMKILGQKKASHGLIFGHAGLGGRAKYSNLNRVFVYQCKVGIDAGGTDDISFWSVICEANEIGFTGGHTHVGFFHCSFIGNTVAGLELMGASKMDFWKTLFTGNKVDLLGSADPHIGATYTFYGCWLECATDAIIKRPDSLKKPTHLGLFRFDSCGLQSNGPQFMDFTGYESGLVEIFNSKIDTISTSPTSLKVINPEKKVRINLYNSPMVLRGPNIFELKAPVLKRTGNTTMSKELHAEEGRD